MTTVHVCPEPLDDHQRGERIFAGDLVVFSGVLGLDAFRDHVDELIRDELGTTSPQTAQFELPSDEYARAVHAVRERVHANPAAHRLLLAALENAGVDIAGTYWDWVHLRVLPHGTEHASAGTGWHRDTWASNISAQTNWWTPIYPVTADRTLRFAPQQWSRAVANTSQDWSPRAVRAHRDGHVPEGSPAPLIPEPLDELTDPPELRVVVQPGDLLCFSGAQLHSTVPNSSGLARFSIEVRTVHQTDLSAGSGAPNIDTYAPTTRYRWFHHALDNTPLTRPAS